MGSDSNSGQFIIRRTTQPHRNWTLTPFSGVVCSRLMTMTDQDKPFNFKENQPLIWFHDNFSLSNQHCLYCHRPVFTGEVTSNKEHLIGRSFVPDGSFNGGRGFNFIFRACVDCNNEKSKAEDHISSVSLYTSPGRNDEHVNALAKRKADQAYHPIQKGKFVKDAFIEKSVSVGSGNMNFEFGLTGPPQLDPSKVQLLAFRHIQGFFSLITSSNPRIAEGTPLLIEEHFWFGGNYSHTDWGNVRIKEIAKRVETWETPLNIETANGFFKVVIRCAPYPGGPWFWALEWNKSCRLFGGIFDIENLPAEFQNLPSPQRMPLGANRTYFQHIPLEDAEDKLFK